MKVGHREVRFTHPDKVLFPDDGITKAELAEHYLRVADAMLPLAGGRPVAMHSFPGGINGPGHFTKQTPKHFPEWIERVTVAKHGGEVTHVVLREAATLAYLAGQNCIAIHVWLSRLEELYKPDRLIIDLDPPDDDFDRVRAGALAAGEMLRDLGLVPYPLATGSRGLHVVVPLRPVAPYDVVARFARGVAHRLAAEHPDTLTAEFYKRNRGNRVFVDTYSNAYAQHAIAPYSVRALPTAPVATPLRWEEVEDPGLTPRAWTIRNFADRLRDAGDPWKGIARHARGIEPAVKRFGALPEE
jgi:bifunctional non-homologous end joining protein LigD